MKRILRKLTKALRLFLVGSYRQAMFRGVGASIEHTTTIRRLDFGVCIDVGANVGQFSLLVRHEKPNARVISFEPLSGPSKVYKNLFSGDANVIFHQTALGVDRSNSEMHVSRSVDSSSLLPISRMQVEQFPGTEEDGRESVTVAPMTDFVAIEQLTGQTLLKIDVQGFELEVLKSAKPLLPYIKWVYVEASFCALYEGQALADEVIAWLREENFQLTGCYNVSIDKRGRAIQADFLFEQTLNPG